MSQISKKIRVFTLVGITLSIVGYVALLYQGYTLSADVENLEAKKRALIKDTIKLAEKNKGLSVETKVLEQKILLAKADIQQLEKGVININANPHNAEEISNGLIEKLDISGKRFVVSTKKDVEKAKDFERQGYQYLKEKDVDSAIASFVNAENSYNGYHQVYEIARYLKQNKEVLSNENSPQWNATFTTISKNFSWKMPADVKSELIALSKNSSKSL